ncbi:hypothetical protein HEB94_000721 [Actinopolymorpha pittospori]|uniref:Uncharacterized protein n=1 Tax=Actinopolymorpha pittospori TaxID=648752 RepID=A0A927RHV0_9ACTN|nr:hypothetical protein [Actinopolymorpha pittospori]
MNERGPSVAVFKNADLDVLSGGLTRVPANPVKLG